MAKFSACFSDKKIVQEVLAQITWYHNIALMDKVKNNVVAECFLKDISEPIGVSEYKITICWNWVINWPGNADEMADGFWEVRYADTLFSEIPLQRECGYFKHHADALSFV